MGYLTRKPTSNDINSQDKRSPWGGDELLDDTALLIGQLGKRCAGCKRVTRNQFLENKLCPDCREKPDEMPDVFKPEYMNLHELTGYTKAHLEGLLFGDCSEQGMKWGKAWIAELILRLEEIYRELPQGLVKTQLSWSFISALIEVLREGDFAGEQELKSLTGSSRAVEKIRCSFQNLLNNHARDNKDIPQLKIFCEILYKKMPLEDRYGPGRLIMEIKLPPSPRRAPRRNYIADGQAGEAD